MLLNAIHNLKCGENYTEKCVSWEFYSHMKSPHGAKCPFLKMPSYAMIFDFHSLIRNFAEPSQSLYWESAEKPMSAFDRLNFVSSIWWAMKHRDYHPYFCPPGRLEPALQRDTQSGPRLPSLTISIYFCLLSSSPSRSIWFIVSNHTCSLKSTVNLHTYKTFQLKLEKACRPHIFIVFL